ncbi:DUF6461 domain-containing protein [Actinomadura alba]|uniref:Uncharacterized protein n=1 Tax=Actinomadura alba TaxID=406431 RepID=A0ABR7M0B9_9ACTN|nr:DUF6461 domain-containing protein [Actinomadura alba]MBC6470460.1 hypothetical protein [Actinomadura alba]
MTEAVDLGGYFGEAACVTLVATRNAEDVARGYGGRMDQARPARLAELGDCFERPQVAVRRVGDWVIAVEINGYQGGRGEVLRRVAEHTRAVNVYWSVNNSGLFAYAADGRVLTTFEALWPERRHGVEPDRLQGEMAGLVWESVPRLPVLFRLAERVTGQVVTQGWLDGEFTIVPIQEWERDLSPRQFNPAHMSLTYEEPVVSYALRHAESRFLRRAAWAAAEFATEAAGLLERPEIAAALRGENPGDLGTLVRSLTDAAKEQGGGPAWSPVKAVEAVRELGGPDPLASAYGAVNEARSALQCARQDLSTFRGVVLNALGNPAPAAGANGIQARAEANPVERHSWITRHWLALEATVIFARTQDLEDVTHALGGRIDRATTGPAVLARKQIALRRAGEWVVAIEFGGGGLGPYQALEWLSAGSVAVCAAWSARGNTLFYHAADGRMRTAFRAHAPHEATGTEPQALRQDVDELGLPLDGHGDRRAPGLLALAERVTGVSLTPAGLDEPHLLVPLQIL